MKINHVIEGEYKDNRIHNNSKGRGLTQAGGYPFNNRYISSYQVLDENTKNSSEYSFWKGALGVAVFGGFGAVAGVGGKNKFSKEYLIAIEWKDGEKSLILLDDEYYKVFIKSMF